LPLKAFRKEQPSVIHFLLPQELSANVIQSEMHTFYGKKCFVTPAIHVCCKMVAHGRESVDDGEEPNSNWL